VKLFVVTALRLEMLDATERESEWLESRVLVPYEMIREVKSIGVKR
jgi:hypothetical protein